MKNTLKKISLFAYAQMRGWQDKKEGRRLFENYDLYVRGLYQKGNGNIVLHTHDGLNITIRQNLFDARIIREIFLDKSYIRHFALPPNPIIVDIGGYIGDFSIYSVKYLKAAHVIVYEPTAENFKILKLNIEDNGYSDRITAVNKAVSDTDEVRLNVQLHESEEVHVSAYWYEGAEKRRIPSVTLSGLFEAHQLDSVDLLKVDCEGCEYNIFPAVPDHIYDRIKNIVFEYHRIEKFEVKLNHVLKRLKSVGYKLRKDKNLVYAYRA